MKMRKIIAVLAAALMLLSILPVAAFAEDTTITFALGANGSASHNDGTSKTSYSETVDGYTLSLTNGTNFYTGARDAKGNSCIKLGSSSKAGSFTISNIPDDVTSVVIYVAAYKAKTATMDINGTKTTLTTKSDNGQYDAITVDTTSTKSITVKVSSGYRAMVNTIEFVIPAAEGDCEHEWELISTTPATCTAAGEEHYACSGCGESKTEAIDALGHTYGEAVETVAPTCTTAGEQESTCSVCGDVKTEAVKALGHNYVDGFCSVCGFEQPLTFELGADGDAVHFENSTAITAYTETVGDYTLTFSGLTNVYKDARDAKGNGCLKLGTGSKAATLSFTVPDDVISVIIKAAKYKTNASTLSVNGTNYTLTKNSNDGEYDEITVDTTENKTIELKTVSGGYRVMLNSITYVLADNGGSEEPPVEEPCDHANAAACATKCPTCGDELTPSTEHTYVDGGKYDTVCDLCGATRDFPEPEADSTLTIAEVLELGAALGGKTTNKYYVSGTIVDVYNTQYGNLNLTDGTDTCVVYGLYSEDGSIRYDAMDVKPIAGDKITVYGQVGVYNSKGQVVDGRLTAHEQTGCKHPDAVFEFDCKPTTCPTCQAVLDPKADHTFELTGTTDATCTVDGVKNSACACGETKSEVIPAGHNYVDGVCTACGEKEPVTATITFDEDKTQRVEFTTEIQVWKNEGLTLTNNKDASTTNVGDYSGRFYKNSKIIIEFPKMNTLVIDAKGIKGDYQWAATLDDAGLTYTEVDGVYTITFAAPTDSITLTAANQVRANSITVYAEAPCEHEYENDCDVDCNICYETREVVHSVQHVEAVAATCTANGNIEYWYCDVCGMAWLDAECTQNTNLKAVVLPMAEHVYFDDCSAICEVCGYEREVSHNVIHVEAVAPTCTANGNIEYWYCDVCGMAWLDAECTLNTNLRAVITPATGEHAYDDEYDADCNVCGDVREVPEKPEGDILYGDADGDGEVTLLDVGMIKQYLAGNDEPTDMVAADADGDGEVTLLDVGMIKQYLAGNGTLGPVA